LERESNPSNQHKKVSGNDSIRLLMPTKRKHQGTTMKTYTVQIHYQATKYFDITAESQVQAERLAVTKAYSDLPDDFYAEAVNTEVTE
jgi:hypothetical protein